MIATFGTLLGVLLFAVTGQDEYSSDPYADPGNTDDSSSYPDYSDPLTDFQEAYPTGTDTEATDPYSDVPPSGDGSGLDPTLDTDEDGLSDLIELTGWEVAFDYFEPNGYGDDLGQDEFGNWGWGTWVYGELKYWYYSDPTKKDTDGGGLPDGFEYLNPYNLAPDDPSDDQADFDGDLLNNATEFEFGTNLWTANSDFDEEGLDDFTEIMILGTDPLDKNDPPAEAPEEAVESGDGAITGVSAPTGGDGTTSSTQTTDGTSTGGADSTTTDSPNSNEPSEPSSLGDESERESNHPGWDFVMRGGRVRWEESYAEPSIDGEFAPVINSATGKQGVDPVTGELQFRAEPGESSEQFYWHSDVRYFWHSEGDALHDPAIESSELWKFHDSRYDGTNNTVEYKPAFSQVEAKTKARATAVADYAVLSNAAHSTEPLAKQKLGKLFRNGEASTGPFAKASSPVIGDETGQMDGSSGLGDRL